MSSIKNDNKAMTVNYKRRYEEALERARNLLSYKEVRQEDMEYLFPELKENEDEKNIKSLIDELKCSLRSANCQNEVCGGGHEKRIALLEWAIAWLEKQKESKPKEDKADEPKFKVGDWVVFNDKHESVYQIEKIENFQYILRHILGGSMPLSFSHEDMIRAWTIQDAKEGDVLVVNNNVFIYAHRKQMYSIAVAHCFIDNAGDFHFDGEFGYVENGNSTYPATRKQRDTLFAKMKEAGYEWDAEKKQVIKL